MVCQDPTPIILVCRTPLRNPAAELLCSALLPLQLHFTAGWPTCPSSLQFTKQQSEGGEGRTHLQGLSRRSERIRDIAREGLENSRHDKSDGLLNRGWNSQLRKSN